MALLILNDHFLKYRYGNWWTGKISDFAGLFFAPLFVCAIVQLLRGQVDWRSQTKEQLDHQTFWCSLVAVDLLFVLLKAEPVLLRFYEQVYVWLGFRVRMIQDPTDLWALLVGGLTYLHVRPYLRPKS
ncbi:MAG: hypothetical protein AB7N80_10970 [Bdellovibrionales bacterium]